MESQKLNPTTNAKVATGPGNEKTKFIVELLDYSLKKRLDEGTKGRIMDLVGKEIEQAGVLGKEILERLERLERLEGRGIMQFNTDESARLISGSNSVTMDALPENNKEHSRKETSSLVKKLGPSNPSITTLFLKEFKTEGSGLKEIVHRPSEIMDMEVLLKTLKEHPVLTSSFDETAKRNGFTLAYKPGFKKVNKIVHAAVVKLVEDFEKIGVPYWQATGIHPFGEKGDAVYTQQAMLFKRAYRFGPASEGYTNLKEMIESIFKENIPKFELEMVFEPDSRKFDLRANIYTWVPAIKTGLVYIANSINDHSNEDGNKKNSKKTVIFKAERLIETNSIEISICDTKSIVNRSAESILGDLRLSEAYSNFHSLCDWTVIFFDGVASHQLNILQRIENSRNPSHVLLQERPLGFIHILRFYES